MEVLHEAEEKYDLHDWEIPPEEAAWHESIKGTDAEKRFVRALCFLLISLTTCMNARFTIFVFPDIVVISHKTWALTDPLFTHTHTHTQSHARPDSTGGVLSNGTRAFPTMRMGTRLIRSQLASTVTYAHLGEAQKISDSPLRDSKENVFSTWLAKH